MNIYLIESPLQLLGAVEAKNYFDHKDAILVIRLSKGRTNSNKQIKDAVKSLRLNKIIFLDCNENRYLNLAVRIIFYVFLRVFRRKVKSVSIGEWQSLWMHRCIEILDHNKAVLFDDGLSTRTVLLNFLNVGMNNKLKISPVKTGLLNRVIEKSFFIVGSRRKSNYKFSVFSSFCSQHDSSTVKVVRHNFELIAQRVETTTTDGVFYFGSKLSEAGLLAREIEISLLRLIFERMKLVFPNKKIYYIPHRDDSNDKLTAISKIGFSIRPLGMPAELYFILNPQVPVGIATMYSSSVYNLSRIFCFESVLFFKIPDHFLLNEKSKSINDIYDFFSTEGLIIFEIDCSLISASKTST